jgi:hypothetical protein
VFKEVILQKGNLFAHRGIMSEDHPKNKKSFQNLGLENSQKKSLRENNIYEG